MLLAGKNAIVYGAGGAIGAAVSEEFAREGARVHLAGRRLSTVEPVAKRIVAAGGLAEIAEVDALDEAQVRAHADEVASRFGTVDVSFSLISVGDVQGTPIVEMALADFERPIHNQVRSFFVTAKAAAPHMIRQGSGVILTFGGVGDPLRDYYIGGFVVGLGAAELMRQQLAAELGKHGIRVVGITTGGVPESMPDSFEGAAEIKKSLNDATLLGRTATLADVGAVAAFAASDKARTLTASTINMTAGAIVN
jgi:NAD(P)-dependent dehydrogenase (short-subunit alcohol dehydrogenase family)